MATYLDARYLQQQQHAGFTTVSLPGTNAPYGGIYRCLQCGHEVTVPQYHVLPPQNHHVHRMNQGPIRWQLIVAHSHLP